MNGREQTEQKSEGRMSKEERLRQQRRIERRRRRRRKILIRRALAAGACAVCLLTLISFIKPDKTETSTAGGGEQNLGGPKETIAALPEQEEPKDFSAIEIPDWIKQDFLTPNPYSRPQKQLEAVNGVVVHYVGNPNTTAEQNRSYFNSLAETKATYASSNFLIGMDGTVIQCMPLGEVAYCSNDRNSDTLSIECCHPDSSGEFTKETYDSLVRLTRWICETFELKEEDVIRHYDVTGKECPKYYVDNPTAWEAFRREVFQ